MKLCERLKAPQRFISPLKLELELELPLLLLLFRKEEQFKFELKLKGVRGRNSGKTRTGVVGARLPGPPANVLGSQLREPSVRSAVSPTPFEPFGLEGACERP